MIGYIILAVIVGLLAVVILANLSKVRSIIEAFKVFYDEVSFEMTKVLWPSQSEVVNSTIIVLVVTMILALGLMAVDTVLGNMLGLIFKS